MCFCPDETAEFMATIHPKARKAYRCSECRGAIAPGEIYTRTSQKWEDMISSDVFCLGCEAWSGALVDAQQIVCGCSGWELGQLWAEIAEFCEEHLGYRPRPRGAI